MVNTDRKYHDSEPVPYPRYRCKGKAKEVRTLTSTYTHQCKRHVDHEGKHACVCGRKWDPATEGTFHL